LADTVTIVPSIRTASKLRPPRRFDLATYKEVIDGFPSYLLIGSDGKILETDRMAARTASGPSHVNCPANSSRGLHGANYHYAPRDSPATADMNPPQPPNS